MRKGKRSKLRQAAGVKQRLEEGVKEIVQDIPLEPVSVDNVGIPDI
ncbi:hypothetical protein QIA27_05595 (plasmid) [Borreliella tanukii]